MKVFQTKAWTDYEQRYRRMLLAIWIALVVGAFIGLAVAESVLMGYVLEELTTHSENGLILKHYALPTSEEYPLFMAHILSASVLMTLTAGVLARMVLSHWRLWVLMPVLAVLPCAVGSVLALFWLREAPQLYQWGVRQIMMIASAQAAASLVGALIGGPVGKLLARVLVPPKWRTFLSHPSPVRLSPGARVVRPDDWREQSGRTR